jgi:predicted Zn-dependent protease
MNLPVPQDDARAAARHVLEFPGADGVEVVVSASTIGLTRYANSQIIQNTVRNEVHANVRVVVGDRVAQASTNQLDADHMKRAAERALEAAQSSPPDEAFPGLPDPTVVGRAEGTYRWDESTAEAAPAVRARAVGKLLDAVGGGSAAGIYETSRHSYGVFSSTGIDCYDGYTRCVTSCLVDNQEATGWAEASSHCHEDVDVEAIAGRAARKAEAGRKAVDAEPGTYEVVLETPAVATFLDFLSYTSFGAKAVIEGESFLATRAGQEVAPSSVTIADDVWDPLSVGVGFDLEGVPKKRVAVIDAGRATGPVTDLRTAHKLGTGNTGHSSGSAEFGPYAANVTIGAGDATEEELIAGVDDGFLVTRFHYTNVLDRPTALLTGMTRDGIFRIRRGEVAEPVHNFRFAQSALDAFGSVSAIGVGRVAFAPDYGSYGSTVAAPVRIGEFRFASTTSH